MANQNSINNTSYGITVLGTALINQSGSAASTIGNSSGGAVAIASGAASTIAIANQSLTITTGTGTISLGADATSKTLNIGSSTGTTAVNITSGSGGITALGPTSINVTGTAATSIGNSSGNMILEANQMSIGETDTANIYIGSSNTDEVLVISDNISLGLGSPSIITIGSSSSTTSVEISGSDDGIINIGTGSEIPITIGQSAGAQSVTVVSGTGGISLASTGTGDIIIDSDDTLLLDSDGVLEINSSAGVISIGNDAVAQNINIATGAAARVVTIGNTTGATGIVLDVGSAGLTIPSFTTTGALVSNASGLITDANASTSGYVLTSNGAGSAPSFQAVSSSLMPWTDVTGTSASMAINNAYSANNAGLVTLTLPSTAAFGSVVQVSGNGAGGWSIAQNSGQTIHFGNVNTTAGVGGSLSSTNRYDQVTLVCSVADTDWVVNSSLGNLTYV